MEERTRSSFVFGGRGNGMQARFGKYDLSIFAARSRCGGLVNFAW
jgi:hypothetical protein